MSTSGGALSHRLDPVDQRTLPHITGNRSVGGGKWNARFGPASVLKKFGGKIGN